MMVLQLVYRYGVKHRSFFIAIPYFKIIEIILGRSLKTKGALHIFYRPVVIYMFPELELHELIFIKGQGKQFICLEPKILDSIVNTYLFFIVVKTSYFSLPRLSITFRKNIISVF